jgi:hypothetical protein
MIKLTRSLQAWNTKSFSDVLKKEVSSLPADELPLQQGLTYSSVALGENLSVIILHAESDDKYITARAGLFYAGVIAGCNCADDPTPVDMINEYCEVQFCISRINGETTVTLLK